MYICYNEKNITSGGAIVEYRLIEKDSRVYVEGRNNNGKDSDYGLYATITGNSKLVFCGYLSEEMCIEIIDFLHMNCIHVDDDGKAYCLKY